MRSMKRYGSLLLVVTLVGVIMFGTALDHSRPGTFLYDTFKRTGNEWTLDEAKAKGQVKLDFRKGHAGRFSIMPFRFEYGPDSGYEVYFKNEGPNEVQLIFEEAEWLSERSQEDLQRESHLILPGDEINVELFNKTGDEDARFYLSVVDETEPRPMVYGEFYIF